MKVLIACEESQEVCKAFRAKGHEAYSCDLQECSGGHPEWRINGDKIEQTFGKEKTMEKMTIRNPDGKTFRIPMRNTANIRIEYQNDTSTCYGSIIDRLGQYEQLGTLEEVAAAMATKRK